MNAPVRPSHGLEGFLVRYCPEPEVLLQILGRERRLKHVADGESLCLAGDEADCVWIVEEGRFRIETEGLIAVRGPGDILGEMAFLREGARRGNDIVSDGRGKVLRIDRSTIDGMPPEARALWFETLSRTLVVKLDGASIQRSEFLREISKAERIVERLVCREGLEATMAALSAAANEPIPMVKKQALVWFSDVAGFSALSEQLDADGVGGVLRRVIGPQVEEIEAAGGQIDKYMGDGVMAFWLCPGDARLARAAADAAGAAERAVARVNEIARRESLQIGIRIGLHAGEVAVGDFGGGQRIAFTLVGQVVNAAARYEQYKPKPGSRDGAIRLSDVVYGQLPKERRGCFHPDPVAFVDKHDRPFTAYLSHI